MMDMQALLADFLNDLEAISDDELLAELETAKRDSKNSYLLDGNEDLSSADIDVSSVITIEDSAPLRGKTLVFINSRQSTYLAKTATNVVECKIPISTSYSFCTNFGVSSEADLWEKGSNVA